MIPPARSRLQPFWPVRLRRCSSRDRRWQSKAARVLSRDVPSYRREGNKCRRKGLAVWRKEGSERPTALPTDSADGCLITAVNVGALVAVHFHRNEMLVNDLRDFGIVVRLAIHDVTPVTPDCSDIEQHGLVLALRSGKGLLPPFIPVDGLVHRRTQVGRSGLSERVQGLGGHRLSVAIFGHGGTEARRKPGIDLKTGLPGSG